MKKGYSIESLRLTGYRGERIPNTFFRQREKSKHLGIVFPGWTYSCHMPLLYYVSGLLLELGADVLWVDYNYSSRPDFQSLAETEQESWLFTDASSASDSITKGAYEQITVIGKSIGTLAMSHVLSIMPSLRHANVIWLTPLLRNETFRVRIKQCHQRSLYVIGTADPQYDVTYLEEIRAATNGEIVAVDGANHALEIEGDVLKSLDALERFIGAVRRFLCV